MWSTALAVSVLLTAAASAAAQSEDTSETPEKHTKHPSWSIGDALTIEATGRLEAAVRAATPDIGLDSAEASWQNRRIGIQGRAFKRFEFELSREVGQDFDASTGGGDHTAWRDAYVDTRLTTSFRVQAGRFKLPFGREELTSEANLDFVSRSLASRVLAPGRDPGVMAHGRLFSKMVEYEAGYFTRDGSNARTSQTDGGVDAFAARIVVTPFASTPVRALAPLEVGAAVADSHLDDRLGIRGRSVLGDSIFFDRVSVNGQRTRVGLEAAWNKGPAGWSAEYIHNSEQRRGMGFSSEDLPAVDAAGWYVSGSWVVTGERKQNRIEPRRAFLQGGVGAIEFAARVEALAFDALTSPTAATLAANADRAQTAGINWYLNRYSRLQLNVIRESIDDPARSPAQVTHGHFVSTVLGLQFRL